ncbi:unnamed protein product [Peniophora sp. CBMAI 1063]|nr:unnamed protein product [Peniophora sp. CBMAI 1063]
MNTLEDLTAEQNDPALHAGADQDANEPGVPNVQGLEDAITDQKNALESTPEGHADRPARLESLALSLLTRFLRLGELHDLEDAIAACAQAVDLTPDSHPDKHVHLSCLGLAHVVRFRRNQSKLYFDAAINVLMDAVVCPFGTPGIRLDSAIISLTLIREYEEFASADTLILAHSRLTQIFPELVWFGYEVECRYQQASQLREIVGTAIFDFIGCRLRYQALDWTETGKSFVWSEITFRDPLQILSDTHPELASTLQDISSAFRRSSAVQRLELPYGVQNGSRPSTVMRPADGIIATLKCFEMATTVMEHQRELVVQYERVMTQIRGLQGFENFLHQPKVTSLVPIIRHFDGPVVFINLY